MKKTFRFETIDDSLKQDEHSRKEIEDLENMSKSFYHWRFKLLTVLHKFGEAMGHKIVYHGVNQKMILKPNPTNIFYGPLSTTSSYHVASTYSTKKGMVLTLQSMFPRLKECKAFDVRLLSMHPTEEEWLIASMRPRILKVSTRVLKEHTPLGELLQVPLSSLMREIFFTIHLFKEQMFSMSGNLEDVLKPFLKNDDGENDDEKNAELTFWGKYIYKKINSKKLDEKERKFEEGLGNDDKIKMNKLFPVLKEKFDEFRNNPNKHQRIKFDTISTGLKPYFMDDDGKDIEKEKKWKISFDKITKIYSNVKEIHFINQYRLDDDLLKRIINQISKDNNKIKKIKFIYYDYKDEDGSGRPSEKYKMFKNPDHLVKEGLHKLEGLGWKITHKKVGAPRSKSKSTGYQIVIEKNKEV